MRLPSCPQGVSLSVSHPALTGRPARPWAGTGLIGLSAVSFGLITTQSRLAYDGGATPLTLAFVRPVAFVIVFGVLLVIIRRPWRLSRSGLVASVWMAGALTMMSIGYLGSVYFIPVSLAALIFYTFPFYVAVLSSLTGREAMTATKALALIAAFVGLALALGPSFAGLDWRGVALALMAAIGVATTIAFGGAVMRANDPLVMNVGINLWMMLALGTYMLGSHGLVFPSTGLGTAGLVGATACYLVAFTSWLLGLRIVNPIRAAVLSNIEPLVTIAAAWIVLGEHLAPLQLLGVALVIAAIIGMTLSGADRPAR
jgi:drug/metabolite transporter (DMT)-like permease